MIIMVARKPVKFSIIETVLCFGTGCLNIEFCRLETSDKLERVQGNNKNTSTPNAPNNGWVSLPQKGRWPANVIVQEQIEIVDKEFFKKVGCLF
jgi:hypothetical protein